MSSLDAALERDLERNQLELVRRWADDLAHEIKNPFHAMVINLELVKRRAGDPEALRERAEVVEAELHRVHDLVDSVLKLIRPWPATEACSVDSVLEVLLPALRARAARRGVAIALEGEGGAVAMAPAHLVLVLLNLTDNALDASPKETTLRMRLRRADRAVELRVADEGSGVESPDGDPLARGLTSRGDRSGLGLWVCHRLVDARGGSLDLTAGPDGVGTVAMVTLPVA